MEARLGAARAARLGWRLWALVPILAARDRRRRRRRRAGSSLADLIGQNPPPADEFDIRRVEFKPGEIRIRVRTRSRTT